MLNSKSTSDFVRRSLALTALLGAGVAVMGAQTTAASTPASVAVAPQYSSSLSSTADNAATAGTNEAALTKPFNFVNAMQYGGRQSYGRPRYRGGNTNADGSAKWIFYGGAGVGIPTSDTSTYLTTGWGIQAGGGRQFNNHIAVPIEFDYDHFGFTNQTLANQTSIYNSPHVFNGQISTLGGTSHVWSFSVDPTFTIYSGEGLGAYVVVGAGFYHKTANFTVPATGEYCDYYYGCYTYQANETIDKYTSNAPGFNGGFGVTYKFSKFSNEKLYAEVRYVYVNNSYKAGFTVANEGAITATSTNLFPGNSVTTTYIPVKVGVRF